MAVVVDPSTASLTVLDNSMLHDLLHELSRMGLVDKALRQQIGGESSIENPPALTPQSLLQAPPSHASYTVGGYIGPAAAIWG